MSLPSFAVRRRVTVTMFFLAVAVIGLVALLGLAWVKNWGGIQEKVQAVMDWLVRPGRRRSGSPKTARRTSRLRGSPSCCRRISWVSAGQAVKLVRTTMWFMSQTTSRGGCSRASWYSQSWW